MKLEDIQVGMRFKYMGYVCTIRDVHLRKEHPHIFLFDETLSLKIDIDLENSYIYFDSLCLSLPHAMSIESFLEKISIGEVKPISKKRKNNYY